jgi:NodT family efflux transporter outer membrane factor (OMF) lipoprotein
MLVACNVPKAPSSSTDMVMPNAYGDADSSRNIAEQNRQQFFASPQLQRLLDTVVSRNFDLAIAAQRVAAARAQNRQAAGALLPQVTAGAVPSLRRFGLYTMDGAGNISTDIEPGKVVPIDLPDFYLGTQMSWEIDIWGKLKNRKKASLAMLLATAEGRNLVLSDLIAETAITYYNLVADDQMLKVLDQTIIIQNEALDMVRVQKDAAVVNELAVQQFNAQLFSMKAMRMEVLQNIVDMEARIHMLAGQFAGPVSRDSVFFSSNALPIVAAGVPSALMRNRPDIRQAEAALIASDANVKAARAAFFPSLNITGALGVQAYKPGFLFTLPESLAYGLFAGITGPLINRSYLQGEFGQASAQQQEALLQYRKSVVNGFAEVYREVKRISNLDTMYQLKEKEYSFQNSSVDVSSDLFRTGRASYLEVLLARQNTLRSNMELINVRKNQLIASVSLYKALGGGWR